MVRLPHPLILLLAGVIAAAALTWILPAGVYDRRDDPATGRRVAVAGTYHGVARAPVGPFAAAVAVPRGFVAGADVVAVVLFVGGAWVVVDRLGTLPALVALLVARFRRRGLWAIPAICLFFAIMGALENMQEEIIPLVPVLLVLGQGLGVDAVVVVAMSAGAAMIGSALGPTNPFQAGIALKLAQLPPTAGGGLRLAMFIAGLALWIAWTMRSRRGRACSPTGAHAGGGRSLPSKHVRFSRSRSRRWRRKCMERFGWTGASPARRRLLVAGIAAGLVGGLGASGTLAAYLEGVQSLLPAALIIGMARSISLVLEDGRVVDTILHALVTPLVHAPPAVGLLLMIPVHAIVHVAVPSVSGQAVLTIRSWFSLADLQGVASAAGPRVSDRRGLTELVTPARCVDGAAARRARALRTLDRFVAGVSRWQRWSASPRWLSCYCSDKRMQGSHANLSRAGTVTKHDAVQTGAPAATAAADVHDVAVITLAIGIGRTARSSASSRGAAEKPRRSAAPTS
jgi:uncharacterized ion transporter superfamily protein YfcC